MIYSQSALASSNLIDERMPSAQMIFLLGLINNLWAAPALLELSVRSADLRTVPCEFSLCPRSMRRTRKTSECKRPSCHYLPVQHGLIALCPVCPHTSLETAVLRINHLPRDHHRHHLKSVLYLMTTSYLFTLTMKPSSSPALTTSRFVLPTDWSLKTLWIFTSSTAPQRNKRPRRILTISYSNCTAPSASSRSERTLDHLLL